MTSEKESRSRSGERYADPDSESAPPARVLVVDDHAAIRELLRLRIEQEPNLELIGTASSLQTARQLIKEDQPDVAVVDLSLPGGSGMHLVREYAEGRGGIRVLVFSMHEEELFADQVLRSGALGYVTKTASVDIVMEAIQTVSRGEVYLSPSMTAMVLRHTLETGESEPAFPIDALTNRERAVCDLISAGLGADEIAERLDLSLKTVEAYRRQAKEKLGFESTTELRRFLVERAIHER